MAVLQEDLAQVNEPTLEELEAALDASNPLTTATAEMHLTPESATEAATFATNFAIAKDHVLVVGFWPSSLVRESFDAPMTRGEIVAFAGYPNRDIVDVAEMSILHVAVADSSEDHIHLKLLTGTQSLIVDGYYDFELTVDGSTGAVTCYHSKVGSFNPNLSDVGKAVLTTETLQANNDADVVNTCNAVLDMMKMTPPGDCVETGTCFFSS